jgi:uncharacterized membrane protein YkgB
MATRYRLDQPVHTGRAPRIQAAGLASNYRRERDAMTTITALLDKFDRLVVWAMDAFGIKFARLALGIVFIWFGALKMIGDLSPAYDLVAATVYWLTPEIIIPLIGLWEVAIGVAFLFPPLTRLALLLLIPQMPATFLPLVLLPAVTFTVVPWGLTLEGQYIVKNLVIIACALIIGGTALRKDRSDREARTGAIEVAVPSR